MLRLLLLVHLPFWRRHPAQALLPALGIALGVAAIVAVDLGSRSTVSSFRHTVQTLEGRTTDQILPGRRPLRGELSRRLVRIEGVEAAAPVLQSLALGEEPLRLLGIDPFSESGIRTIGLDDGSGDPALVRRRILQLVARPGALLISRAHLRRHGLAPGDSLELAVGPYRTRAFVLDALPARIGDLEIPGDLAVGDLATVQELTHRADVSRIDLVITSGQRRRALQAVRALLPPEARLVRPGGDAAHLRTMMSALRTNLRALSFLALFVSLFLIYNAMLLAVLRRRAELGTLRCLGATRGEILGAWLVEALWIGLLGTALGLLLGLGAGRWTLAGIARTASDLYAYVRADQIAIVPSVFLRAGIAGVAASVVAALAPALEAARTPPVRVASRGQLEDRAQQRMIRAAWLALPLLAVAAIALLASGASVGGGYLAAACIALATAALAPFLGHRLLVGLRPLLGRLFGEIAALAARNIAASLSRTGVALAALSVALSMSIAMGTMISSFHHELRGWIADSVRADVYVSPATAEIDRFAARLDPQVVEILRRRPEVEAIDTYRGGPARVRGVDTFVAGIDVAVFRRGGSPRLVAGPSPTVFLDRLEGGQAAISEALMRRTGLRPGDRFEVEAFGQRVEFEVAGVHRDYSSDRGVVLVDRRTWKIHFGDDTPHSVALYLRDGEDVSAVVDRLRRELGGRWALLVRSNRSLREQADRVFVRTFGVARGLETIGVAVAAIGILAALLALLLERGRELATLRALGMSRRQLRGLLLGESALLAVLAWLFALAGGSALAWVLLHVVHVRSFGWMLPFRVPLGDWFLDLLWGLAAAGLATWIPLRRARRLSVAAGLREE